MNTIVEHVEGAVSGISVERLLAGYRSMVLGRRLDQQATTFAKQGILTVYPSSWGQEACQVAASHALRENDWLFPTYRDTVAILSRGVEPDEALTLFRGDWHCGYDPKLTHTAPHATPLATHAPHAVGLAIAARNSNDDAVALVLCGEGATSEGDFHEALNLAAVYDAPVVFLVQNNGYAISVPAHRQYRARHLVDRAVGYGVAGALVDGNDYAAVLAALEAAVRTARTGGGPTLVEATTYRMSPHTNSDDPTRYRTRDEEHSWAHQDPIRRLGDRLRESGALTLQLDAEIRSDAETAARRLRRKSPASPDPGSLFAHVYADEPSHLRRGAGAAVAAQAIR